MWSGPPLVSKGTLQDELKNLFLSKNFRGFHPNLIQEVFAVLEIVVDLDDKVRTESDDCFVQLTYGGFLFYLTILVLLWCPHLSSTFVHSPTITRLRMHWKWG